MDVHAHEAVTASDNSSEPSVYLHSGAGQTYENGNLRWWFLCSITCVLLFPIVSVMSGLHLHARDLYIDPLITPHFSGRTLLLEVVLVDIDPACQIVKLNWLIVGESNSPCGGPNMTLCTSINVFFDNNLIDGGQTGGGAVRNSNIPMTPIFVHNSTASAIGDTIANTPLIRTNLIMLSRGLRKASLIYYPFDIYSTEIFMFAQDAANGEKIGVRVLGSYGISNGFKTKVYPRMDTVAIPGVINTTLEISRGNLVKAFSIVITIAMWLITLVLIIVMLTCIFFGFKQRGEVLVIPVATLFAFTQLRESMPGATSGFGDLIDFVGLLPCLALLTASAALSLGAFIFSDPTVKNRSFSWEDLCISLNISEIKRRNDRQHAAGSEETLA